MMKDKISRKLMLKVVMYKIFCASGEIPWHLHILDEIVTLDTGDGLLVPGDHWPALTHRENQSVFTVQPHPIIQ